MFQQTDSRPRSTRRSRLWQIAKIILAVALFGTVAAQISVVDLVALWQRIAFLWLLPSAALFFAISVVMARRSWLLLDRRAAYHNVLGTVIAQTAIGNLFATSAGAASYVAILRGRHQISISRGIASIVLSKLGDLFMLLLALIVTSAIVWPQIEKLHVLIVLLALALTGVIAACALSLVFRERLVSRLHDLIGALRLGRIAIVTRGIDALAALAAEDARVMRPLLAPFLFYSAASLLLTLGFGYANMRLFDIPIELAPILFVTVLIQIISWVPVQVFGGLGTYEVTGIFLLSLFVANDGLLAPFMLSSRIYLYLLTLALLSYLIIEHWIDRMVGTLETIEGR